MADSLQLSAENLSLFLNLKWNGKNRLHPINIKHFFCGSSPVYECERPMVKAEIFWLVFFTWSSILSLENMLLKLTCWLWDR